MNNYLHDYIAFTDLEMTGLDVVKNEIIEIGLVLTNASTLEIVSEYEVKTKPEHIETGQPEGLRIAGYNEIDWEDAISINEGLLEYNKRIPENTIFASSNTPYDWMFYRVACEERNIEVPFSHHSLDVHTAAYELLKGNTDLKKISLSNLSAYFGLEREPMPHRAINGARNVYEVYKKLQNR